MIRMSLSRMIRTAPIGIQMMMMMMKVGKSCQRNITLKTLKRQDKAYKGLKFDPYFHQEVCIVFQLKSFME